MINMNLINPEKLDQVTYENIYSFECRMQFANVSLKRDSSIVSIIEYFDFNELNQILRMHPITEIRFSQRVIEDIVFQSLIFNKRIGVYLDYDRTILENANDVYNKNLYFHKELIEPFIDRITTLYESNCYYTYTKFIVEDNIITNFE